MQPCKLCKAGQQVVLILARLFTLFGSVECCHLLKAEGQPGCQSAIVFASADKHVLWSCMRAGLRLKVWLTCYSAVVCACADSIVCFGAAGGRANVESRVWLSCSCAIVSANTDNGVSWSCRRPGGSI